MNAVCLTEKMSYVKTFFTRINQDIFDYKVPCFGCVKHASKGTCHVEEIICILAINQVT